MRIHHIVCIAVIGLISVTRTQAANTLYAATAGAGAGELYTLNPSNGATISDIGPLNDASALNYGVTGLAFDPVTNTMYGSTGNSGATDASTHAKLVSINLTSGLVTPIGVFNVGAGNTMTDLAIDPTSGTLYGIGSVGGAHLYSVDKTTGQATLVGNSGFGFTTGGGIAITSAGTVYGSPDVGHFGTYSKVDGSYVQIANPGPEPATGGAYAGMSFNQSGVLYSSFNSSTAHLVTINLGTGTVTNLGNTVSRIDAIEFTPEPAALALF
ncbi:MAG TPA: hypothetical protein VL282_19595, partial [Tepidisphaeraceae bacterium]|nr:hypothetical protein [Tepidisphaeraceae bacterium]